MMGAAGLMVWPVGTFPYINNVHTRWIYTVMFALAGAAISSTVGFAWFDDIGMALGALLGAAVGAPLGHIVARRCLIEEATTAAPAREPLVRVMDLEEAAKLPVRTVSSDDLALAMASSAASNGGLELQAPSLPSCAVCLEAFAEGDVQRTLPCFHVFHRACVDSWLATSDICPTCRHAVRENQLTENR